MAATSVSLVRIRRGAILLAAVVSIAVAGYMAAGWSFIDAVYMVVITIFGVGYGEVHPVDSSVLKLFTMSVVIAGCSAGLWVVGGLVEFIAEGTINEALGRRRMSKQIGELKGHVIICGFGRVGRVLAGELRTAGTPVLLVDTDASRLAEAEALGYHVLVGDASEERVLREANIAAAKVVAIVLPDDASNVFVTLSARELNSDVEIIARGERPETERKLLRSGANRVVLPAAAGANRIARMITHPSAECLLRDERGMAQLNEQLLDIGLQFTELAIPADSPLAGATVADIDLRDLASVVIVAVRKEDGEIRRNPHGSTLLEPNDTIILVGRRGDLPRSLRRTSTHAGIRYRGATPS